VVSTEASAQRWSTTLVTPLPTVRRVIAVCRVSKPSARRLSVSTSALNAALLPRPKDRREEERAQTKALPAVRHDEADVGRPVVRKAVSRHADQLGLPSVVDFGDDGHPPVIVDVRESVRLLGKESTEREESLIQREWAQPTAQRHQTRLVVGTDRADAHRGTVAQDHAPFRVGQVSRDLGHQAFRGLGHPAIPARVRTHLCFLHLL
jgi:hypothetical protein